jgi:microcystin-dependent protein
MAEPFLAEIRIMSFNFPPKGWALCNGLLLPINQNQALFALLGTTFGGNGQTNFALPDFRGRVPMHVGAGFINGQRGGEEVHTVTQSEMPAHLHLLMASSTQANAPVPQANVLAATTPTNVYAQASNLTPLRGNSVTNVGGSQAHENRQPYTVLSFCIALQGIFPSPN